MSTGTMTSAGLVVKKDGSAGDGVLTVINGSVMASLLNIQVVTFQALLLLLRKMMESAITSLHVQAMAASGAATAQVEVGKEQAEQTQLDAYSQGVSALATAGSLAATYTPSLNAQEAELKTQLKEQKALQTIDENAHPGVAQNAITGDPAAMPGAPKPALSSLEADRKEALINRPGTSYEHPAGGKSKAIVHPSIDERAINDMNPAQRAQFKAGLQKEIRATQKRLDNISTQKSAILQRRQQMGQAGGQVMNALCSSRKVGHKIKESQEQAAATLANATVNSAGSIKGATEQMMQEARSQIEKILSQINDAIVRANSRG